MATSKFLSGEQLIAKGATKVQSTLPEVGSKDVMPNGSWLEQKQIQAAIEARKHLIDIERIDKSGTLSHAEWREDLNLALVIKNVGSHWQYIGHNVGNQLFLKPEETLFLMEMNCLHLKYNGVTVSLQQAYSILLRNEITILHYKVYASLSRLGYKVFRHDLILVGDNQKKINIDSALQNIDENKDHVFQNIEEKNNEKQNINDHVKEEEMTSSKNDCVNVELSKQDCSISKSSNTTNITDFYNKLHKKKLHKLKMRKNKQYNTVFQNAFDDIPDILQKQDFTIKAPEEKFIPNSIKLSKNMYVFNLKNITDKPTSTSVHSRTYSSSDEVNEDNILRIQEFLRTETPNWTPRTIPSAPRRFPYYNYQQFNFRPYSFQRFSNPLNCFPFNLPFNGPFFPHQRLPFFRPFYQFQQRQRVPFNRSHLFQNHYGGSANTQMNFQNRYSRKRPHESSRATDFAEASTLTLIKNAAEKLKHQTALGINNQEILQTLQKLIQNYNARYETKLLLNNKFEVIKVNEIETIDLAADDNPSRRKRKCASDTEDFRVNLDKIKLMALRLKNMTTNGNAHPKDRRAFSKLLKTFNSSYNAAIYMNHNLEICDSRHIILDSSSDSDCILEEEMPPKTKKLKNPFSILKRFSLETNNVCDGNMPSTSKDYSTDLPLEEIDYSNKFEKTFNNWLPKEKDFGRAEVPPKIISHFRLTDANKLEYIYAFMSYYKHKRSHDNWTNLKIYFWETIKHNSHVMHEEYTKEAEMQGGLTRNKGMFPRCKKCVINTCKDIPSNTKLTIHFDVYERNVQHFRKSQKPAPHFRIICVEENSGVPSGSDIAAIHSKYCDNVPIVLAVVKMGSISYLQMTPENLPINIQEPDSLN